MCDQTSSTVIAGTKLHRRFDRDDADLIDPIEPQH
jgi:hypothetical protein